MMERLAEFVIANRKVLLPTGILGVILLASGMSQLKLEDDFIRYFDERYQFRQEPGQGKAMVEVLNTLLAMREKTD